MKDLVFFNKVTCQNKSPNTQPFGVTIDLMLPLLSQKFKNKMKLAFFFYKM